MALRHAVLAALLDGEYSGYQLAKAFDIGVANFWHALPQQLYAELAKLEKEGLLSGRQVLQEGRPNKRLFRVTEAGRAELEAFAETVAKPSFIRDDLMVKVQAADLIGTAAVIAQLEERAEVSKGKVEFLTELLRTLRGGAEEDEYLRHGERIGPYLTCLRGVAFEQETRDWCLRIAAVLRARQENRAEHA
ncbi:MULTISPECIES: PadR family transcriptional regulator [unclassified Kitasatospora]|uniref:PadR family transcriptional regulator n=1 Tax=unclassified Kitasatospora TaxID=2633591 RepID=UPI00070BF8DF|nr:MULTISPECIES: PadR family transcriptional regulator [unclassified Kitasatospora]KQV04753.1 PadR family transcriptional regulator [Kitasatospora sp. Root107]KRB60723.1 PadR family transcriptional regulator [Kitasatospora sp. Root187]